MTDSSGDVHPEVVECELDASLTLEKIVELDVEIFIINLDILDGEEY